jgi:hypothetical protein
LHGSVAGGLEYPLRELEQTLLPMLEIVGVFVDVPDVRHPFLLEVGVHTLTDADGGWFQGTERIGSDEVGASG